MTTPDASPPADTDRQPDAATLVRIRALSAVIGLSLLVRVIVCLHPVCIDRNGVINIDYAKWLGDAPIAAMKGTTKQPGYSAALLGLHRVLAPFIGHEPESWQLCGTLLALAGGVLTSAAVYLLALRLFNARIALLAGLFAVFWPHSVNLSTDAYSDLPALALCLFSLLSIYAAVRYDRLPHLLLGSLLAGAAYLMRQEAMTFLISGLIAWLYPAPRRSRTRSLLGAALLLGVFALCAVPHSLAVGRLMPNKSFHELLFGSPQAVTLGLAIAPSLAKVIPFSHTPLDLAGEWARSGRYVISTLVVAGLFLPFVPRAEQVGRRFVILAAALHILAVLLRVKSYGEFSPRYAVILLALSLPWAAATLDALITAICQRLRRRDPARDSTVWAVSLLIVFAPLVAYSFRPAHSVIEHYRTSGQWLHQAACPQDRILAHEHLEQLLFYADRCYPSKTWIKCLRTDTGETFRDIIRRERPLWYVDAQGSHHEEGNEEQHFKTLLSGAIPELRLVHSEGPPGYRVYIFAVDLKATPGGATSAASVETEGTADGSAIGGGQ